MPTMHATEPQNQAPVEPVEPAGTQAGTQAETQAGTKEGGDRAWRLVLTAGLAALAAYFLLPGGRANQIAYLQFGWASLAILVYAAFRQPRGRRLFLALFAAGVASFVAGDAVWASYRVVRNVAPPYPSPGDFGWLGAYIFWTASLFVLHRGRRPARDRGGLIDAGIIFVGVGLLQLIFLIGPHLSSPDTPLLVRLTSAAYPIGDLLLLVMAARLLFSPGAKTPAFRFLLLSIGVLLVTDAVYGVYVLHAPYHRGNPIDAGWLSAYILFAAAALHPSVREMGRRVPDLPTAPTRLRLVFLAVISLVAPALIALEHVTPGMHHVLLGAGAATLFLLVIGRMAGLVAALRANNAELARAQEARGVLLKQAVSSAERERSRLAAELHDGPIQRMAALGLRIEQVKQHVPAGDAEAAELLAQVQTRLGTEIRGLRHLMSELRPPALDERGLASAVCDLASTASRDAGIRLADRIEPCGDLPDEVEVVLYRVAQEALGNVTRHARASEVSVSLRVERGSAVLTVTDDGCGFDLSSVPSNGRYHLGLALMRERVELAGGTWALRSLPGRGTRVEASISLAQERAA